MTGDLRKFDDHALDQAYRILQEICKAFVDPDDLGKVYNTSEMEYIRRFERVIREKIARQGIGVH